MRLARGQRVEHRRVVGRQRHDLILVHTQHHGTHHGRHCVVEVHDGAPGAGNAVFFDQLAHKVEFHLGRGWKTDFDFLEANRHELLEHAHLPGNVHGLHQRLVAIAQVRGQPDGRAGQDGIGPGAVFEADRGECTVLGVGVLEHVVVSARVGKSTSNPKNKTARCWCERAEVRMLLARYRIRP